MEADAEGEAKAEGDDSDADVAQQPSRRRRMAQRPTQRPTLCYFCLACWTSLLAKSFAYSEAETEKEELTELLFIGSYHRGPAACSEIGDN
jgi:hypothetical protein